MINLQVSEDDCRVLKKHKSRGPFLKVAHKEAFLRKKSVAFFITIYDGKHNSSKCSFLIVEVSSSVYKCIAY